VFFAVVFDEDYVAGEQRLEVVGYHALFLSKRGGKFGYAHGFGEELLDGGESGGLARLVKKRWQIVVKAFFHGSSLQSFT
jgi:hypothetical protein